MTDLADLTSLRSLTGVQVVESPHLPLYPRPGEDGRRIVRHGMADILAWLGEPVGPKPGAPTHAMLVGDTLHASAAIVGRLFADEKEPTDA